MNAITAIDGYKTSHAEQYPKGMTRCYSNFTPRSTRYLPKSEDIADDSIVFLGSTYFMQWFLRDNFNKNFFAIPKATAVRKFERLMKHYLGDAAPKSDRIAALHDLQYLPITVRALDEGTVVPAGVPVLTIENTVDDFYWIPNYLETILSNMLWMMSTNATIARKYKLLLTKYAKETGGAEWFIPFQAHDFSFRGMSSPQSAEMSGFAHLTSFTGTDTIPALEFAEEYYGADLEGTELVGCSVPATEHSVMCAGISQLEAEIASGLHPDAVAEFYSDSQSLHPETTRG